MFCCKTHDNLNELILVLVMERLNSQPLGLGIVMNNKLPPVTYETNSKATVASHNLRRLCKDYFVFILSLFLFHGWMRLFKLYFIHLGMVKYFKMVLNQIIVIVFEILLMYIVRNVSILLQYIFLDGWLFYFDFIALVFIRYGYDTPTKNALIIITTIIIAKK